MDIHGTTRVFLILADPIAQVRAPEVFNHVFSSHGIDAVLVPAHVREPDLHGFIREAMKARNIDGLWLTIPYKTQVLRHLAAYDRLTEAAGAANAVRRRDDGTLEGGLFDGVGFVKALDHFGVATAGRRALVVGTGGAGVAIAASLAERGAMLVGLYDIATGRADTLARRLRQVMCADVRALQTSDPQGFDIVVNATPLGLDDADPLPFDVNRLSPQATVVDILMKNQPTKLVRACRDLGIAVHPGYEMLVQQVPEYLDFFGYGATARAVQADLAGVRRLLDGEETT